MRQLAVAMAAVTVIRLVVAATAPLAPDEAYYWVWSQALAAGYLDHPPMVALWIKAGTALLGQTVLGVRLLGPLAAALASWMLFDSAQLMFSSTMAGLAAAALLNASLLLGVGTVVMTPDSPLLFFWTAALWAMVRLAMGGSGSWWLATGFFGGLALDSKYTALFLWIGIALWTLIVPTARRWLWRWQPWAACAIGLALFAPVLAWNAGHNWAGLVRQGARVEDWRPARAFGFLAELLGGQIALVTPLVWLLCMAGLVAAVRRTVRQRDPAWSLLAALSLPPILVFVQHAIGDRVQGNWPAIIYPALAVAAGGLVDTDPDRAASHRGPAARTDWSISTGPARSFCQRWWISAVGLGFAITALAYVQATTGLIPLPPRFDPITTRLAGWIALARQVAALKGTMDVTYIAVDGYGPASELAWWMPPGLPVIGTDARWAPTTLPQRQIAGMPGLLVRDARHADPPDPDHWKDAALLATVTRPGSDYAVFYVKATAGAAKVAELPCRRCLAESAVIGKTR